MKQILVADQMKTDGRQMCWHLVKRWIVVGGLVFLVGCGQDDSPNRASTDARTPTTASSDEIPDLRRFLLSVIRRYRDCSTYADQSRIRLSYDVSGGERITDETQMTIRYARPNRLSYEVANSDNQIEIRSDGKQIAAKIHDKSTNDFAGQICQRPIKTELTVNDIYSVTEISDPQRPNAMSSILLGLPVHLLQTQFGMLLDDLPIDQVVSAKATVNRLADQRIGDVKCVRLQVRQPSETSANNQPSDTTSGFTIWIDAALRIVRRIEYPTQHLFSQNTLSQRPSNIYLALDIDQAEFDRRIDPSAFSLAIPDDSRLVNHFVLPPLPLPNERLGKKLPEFELTTLDGQTEKCTHWQGKHAVLIWFDEHEASKKALSAVEQVFRKWKDRNDVVVFRAIAVEPPDRVSSKQIRSRLNDWRITFPATRDLQAVGRDVFQVNAAPSVIVHGKDDKLHFFSEGANPQLAQDIHLVLESLTSGIDVGGGVVKQYENELIAFQRQLANATIAPAEHDISKIKPAPKSEPEKMTLAPLWTSSTSKAPGNVLAIRSKESGRLSLFVVDDLKDIVELDEAGLERNRYQPELAKEDAITYLRGFQTRAGKQFFVAWSMQGKCAYLFDEQFELVLRYPRNLQDHPGIQDVFLSDLDSNEEIELYVAFRDPVGLHRIAMNGERVWSSRTVTGISSLARDPAGFGRLLACSDNGRITPIFMADGNPEKPILVAGRTIHSITNSGSKSTRPTQLLGMSYTLDGRLIAIGLNRNLQEQWSYGLPNGVYPVQLDSPTSVHMFAGSKWQWLLAGPDGSVHVIDDDGQFYDAFNSGQLITGITAYRSETSPVLVLATQDSVRAFTLNKKE